MSANLFVKTVFYVIFEWTFTLFSDIELANELKPCRAGWKHSFLFLFTQIVFKVANLTGSLTYSLLLSGLPLSEQPIEIGILCVWGTTGLPLGLLSEDTPYISHGSSVNDFFFWCFINTNYIKIKSSFIYAQGFKTVHIYLCKIFQLNLVYRFLIGHCLV